ncbi:MAG: hypothetical protein JWR44_1925 [Hymenobacter sp.]|jgi:hypothetical protein|nr:hypothetical protein [Hymenobacter sp.]
MRLAFSTRFVLICVVALLSALPLALGYYINETSPAPTEQRLASRCSRYCEHHGCPHATPTNSPAFFQLRPLYVATIKGLAAGGRGLYATANIAFYVVLIPLLLMGLTYGALRNAVLIHRLKAQSHE